MRTVRAKFALGAPSCNGMPQLHRTRLLYTALLATIGLSRSKPHYKGPPPLRPSCLNHTEGLTSAPDYTPAWDSKIHVAFYDTRRKPRIYDMRMAAALFNTTQVMFHVLLARPPQQPVPGMRVTDISRLPPLAGCLHRNLKRLAHGPGPQYLMKPLLHWVLPREVKRVILLDTDVVVLHGIAPLWALVRVRTALPRPAPPAPPSPCPAPLSRDTRLLSFHLLSSPARLGRTAQFARFGGDAVLGVGNEQSNLYKKNMTGKNGGVQLLSLAKMRSSRSYTEALDSYASGRDGRWARPHRTAHYSLLTTHCALGTARRSPLTAH